MVIFEENSAKRIHLLLLILVGCIAWVLVNWGILSREYIFSHDSYYWYGLFHYFAESVQNGFIPLWNPYAHSGEIFFTNIGAQLLLDPLTLIGIVAGKIFKVKDLFYLYEIITFLRLILIATGIQLFLNEIIPKIKKYWYFTFFVLLLSSFTINAYHQSGSFLIFSYIPFILLFMVRFFKDPSWLNTTLLGYFSGISFQSYLFAAIGTFVLFFLLLYLLFNRKYWHVLWKNKLKVTVCIILFITLSAPAWSLLFYRSYIFPYARFIVNPSSQENSIIISNIEILKKSIVAFGRWGDFFSLGYLPLASSIYTGKAIHFFSSDIPLFGERIYALGKEIKITEMNMYVALIPFILGIIGIFKGKNKFKWIFLILLFLSGCLFLGPTDTNLIFKTLSNFYKVLFYIFLPLRVIENTHEFATYFLFFYFYFICLGLLYITSKIKKNSWKLVIVSILFIITLFELGFYVNKIYSDQGTPFRLLRDDKIAEKNINEINSTDVEEIIFAEISEGEKTKFLTYYERQGDIYTARDDVQMTNSEEKELAGILEKFFLLEAIPGPVSEFNFVEKRIKTILPYSYINNIKKEERDTYSYVPVDYRIKLNFLSTIYKIPTATGYFSDFSYDLFKIMPPTTLTMPVLYADILKSDISQELKGKLLGVDLPILEFYTDYIVLNPKEIINPKYNDLMLNYLENTALLSEGYSTPGDNSSNGSKSDYKIDIISYNPNHIKMNISTSNDGLLLFRDGYSSGWKSSVDGKVQKVIKANYNQKAIYIEKGIHEVEFIFRPLIYIIALYLYFIFSGVFIIFCIYYLFKRGILIRRKN